MSEKQDSIYEKSGSAGKKPSVLNIGTYAPDGDSDEDLVRLASPRAKGLLGLVFSRFFLIAVLLILQIAIIASLIVMFDEKLGSATTIHFIFAIVMAFYLFNKEMDSSAKMTWLFIIAMLPVGGPLFFIYTQSNIGHNKLKSAVNSSIDESKDRIPQDESVLEEIKDSPSVLGLNKYLNNSGCFPLFKNTDVQYYPVGEEMFESMLDELEKAEDFIFMEYFIVDEGYMFGKILDILIRKAQEGVDVRFMYDGMCEISTLPHNYPELLRRKGIKAKSYAPLKPFVSTHYNYRDHRKIMVIDGKTAFTGGINLADEYINHIVRFGHWKDTGIMLKGEAVSSFTLMFLQMWGLRKEHRDFSRADISFKNENGDGYVMPFCDSPMDDDKAAENVYISMLNTAEKYVYIHTPYLIMDDEMKSAIRLAASRGVDVRLILPGIPDKTIPYALAKSHYKALIRSGVKIYEYTPGFVHSKVCLSDDCKAVVGTINFDYRSLYHHFECGVFLYQTPCISDIRDDIEDNLEYCEPVTQETIKNTPLKYKIIGVLMKPFAPLM